MTLDVQQVAEATNTLRWLEKSMLARTQSKLENRIRRDHGRIGSSGRERLGTEQANLLAQSLANRIQRIGCDKLSVARTSSWKAGFKAKRLT